MQTHEPEKAGMSSKRLERITPIMEGFVKDNQLPGILTVLQRRGKVVHFGKFGTMDIEAKKPMQEDALFRIYSMTKPIVSVALMMLYEEGRFSLTDPVANFIPAFAKTKVHAGPSNVGMRLVDQFPPMNLHHLLTHTSGLSYGWGFDSPVEELYRQVMPTIFHRHQTLQESIERLAELPLLFQPGTAWRYSLAVDVIGYVIQVVADMPLADYLEKNIFKPLGMVDTAFHVPAEKVNRLAQIYRSDALYNPQPIPPAEVGMIEDVTKPTLCPAGGAGLVSTLADYLSFCRCLLNNGAYEGGRLLSRKTLEWMASSHVPASWLPLNINQNKLDHSFGLGFRVATDLGMTRVLTSPGEYGWGGAANTFFWVDPAEEFTGVMMTQHLPAHEYPVIDRFRALSYQAIID